MSQGTTTDARTTLHQLQDKLRHIFGRDILREEGSSSQNRDGQEGGQTRKLRTESQEERRKRTGKAPMEGEPAPRDEILQTQPALGEETRRTSTPPNVRYARQAATPSDRSRGTHVVDGTGDCSSGAGGDGEYSVGHVDGDRGIGKGRYRITGEPHDNFGGKQAQKSGEGNWSAGSIGFREEGIDAVE